MRQVMRSRTRVCVSHSASAQVGLHGGDQLALFLQRLVQIILLVARNVLEHLVHQLVVL